MDNNNPIPSQVTNTLWVYAFNPHSTESKDAENAGKWLLFEHISKVDTTWETIKKATENGLLGPASKCATAKLNPRASDSNNKVICVYTDDLNDEEDVKRIEKSLRSIGIEHKLLYKLNKDIDKIAKNGHKNISKKMSFSPKYYEVLEWLKQNPNNPNIELLGENNWGNLRFALKKGTLSEADFLDKKLYLEKIGFRIQEQTNDKIIFSE